MGFVNSSDQYAMADAHGSGQANIRTQNLDS